MAPTSRIDDGTTSSARRKACRAAVTQAWLRAVAAAIKDQRARLTELDAAIGDGDHGINLDRGFGTVVADLDAGALPVDDAGALLVAAGRRILGSVGGASGALYGRGLIRAGERLAVERAPGSEAIEGEPAAMDPDGALLVEAIEAAVGGIVALGRAEAGDKTMLDALLPALAALRAARSTPLVASLGSAARAAEAGAQATLPMLARKGRASYLGERSVGHLDPGAVSSALLLGCLAEVVGATR